MRGKEREEKEKGGKGGGRTAFALLERVYGLGKSMGARVRLPGVYVLAQPFTSHGDLGLRQG